MGWSIILSWIYLTCHWLEPNLYHMILCPAGPVDQERCMEDVWLKSGVNHWSRFPILACLKIGRTMVCGVHPNNPSNRISPYQAEHDDQTTVADFGVAYFQPSLPYTKFGASHLTLVNFGSRLLRVKQRQMHTQTYTQVPYLVMLKSAKHIFIWVEHLHVFFWSFLGGFWGYTS